MLDKFLSLLFLLSCCVSGASISGKVVDAKTQQPVPLVNVFLANTTIGDAADEDGVYQVENIRAGVYQLVVSHIGYDVHVQEIKLSQNQRLQVNIALQPRVIEGLELMVQAEDAWEWRRLLRRFKRIFIGDTINARKCKILHPEYLSFDYNDSTRVFTAYSDSVLVLENMALGYRINVVLNYFCWDDGGGLYATYPHYVDLSTEFPQNAQKWAVARRQTYKGSLRHFLCELAKNRLIGSSFIFKMYEVTEGDKNQVLVQKDWPIRPERIKLRVLSTDPTLVRWEFQKYMAINSEIYEDDVFSFIKLLNGYADIDEYGNITNARDHKVAGEWAKYRMADTLPMDYVFEPQ